MYFSEHDVFAKSFEDAVNSLSWHTCNGCNEKVLRADSSDVRCPHKERCQHFSALNNMDPGPVPDVLQDLTFIEEQLIARVHPFVSVFKLKGLQFGYKGHVISFRQDVDKFAMQLPHKLQHLQSVVCVKYRDANLKYHDFVVRGGKILAALEWLKANNKYYENISIDYEYIASLPENGNVESQLLTVPDKDSDSQGNANNDIQSEGPELQKISHSSVPTAFHASEKEQIDDFLEWPKLSKEPLSDVTTPGLICCAFPTLFPYGRADLRDHRLHTIDTSSYIKHLLNYKDRRFAQHVTFRFFVFNSWMRWRALADGNLFVKKNANLGNMTASELKEKLDNDRGLLKKIMFYASNLRGTKSYWHARAGELRDMVEQLGLPTLFLTLSAADMHWEKLFQLITEEENVSSLSMQDKMKLVQENPLIVDTFFHHRVQLFIRHVSHTFSYFPSCDFVLLFLFLQTCILFVTGSGA